jgi:hypothetical protein
MVIIFALADVVVNQFGKWICALHNHSKLILLFHLTTKVFTCF